jgi:hypothetical protein
MNVEMMYSEDLIGLWVREQVGSKDHLIAEENSFEAIRSPKHQAYSRRLLKALLPRDSLESQAVPSGMSRINDTLTTSVKRGRAVALGWNSQHNLEPTMRNGSTPHTTA